MASGETQHVIRTKKEFDEAIATVRSQIRQRRSGPVQVDWLRIAHGHHRSAEELGLDYATGMIVDKAKVGGQFCAYLTYDDGRPNRSLSMKKCKFNKANTETFQKKNVRRAFRVQWEHSARYMNCADSIKAYMGERALLDAAVRKDPTQGWVLCKEEQFRFALFLEDGTRFDRLDGYSTPPEYA